LSAGPTPPPGLYPPLRQVTRRSALVRRGTPGYRPPNECDMAGRRPDGPGRVAGCEGVGKMACPHYGEPAADGQLSPNQRPVGEVNSTTGRPPSGSAIELQ